MKAASRSRVAGARHQRLRRAAGQEPPGVHGHQPVEATPPPPCRRWRRARSSPDAGSRMRASSCQNWRRDSGSMPVVGSSRISTSGSCRSAQHSPSFCFMPPDSLPAGRSRNGASPVPASSASMRRRRSPRPAGRTGGRRNRRCRGPTAARRDCGPAPAACRRSAARRRAGSAAERMSPPSTSHGAALDRPRAGDQAEQRGLADAVGADETGQASGRDVQRRARRRARTCRTGGSAPGSGRPGRTPPSSGELDAQVLGPLGARRRDARRPRRAAPSSPSPRCRASSSGSMRTLTRNMSFSRSARVSTSFGRELRARRHERHRGGDHQATARRRGRCGPRRR